MTETINVANIDKVHKNPIAELVQTACQFESHIDISSEGKNICLLYTSDAADD